MTTRKELVSFLDELLKPDEFNDYTFNGIQIEGRNKIDKVGFAVDPSLEVIERCVEFDVGFLITHHGLIWKPINSIKGPMKDKILLLLENSINLYVSHLPLDAHPELGNNVQIARELSIEVSERFYEIGVWGTLPSRIPFDEFMNMVRERISPYAVSMNYGTEEVYRVGIVSGAVRSSIVEEADEMDIDVVVVGEGNSPYPFFEATREYGINVIFAGHYATETFGIKALMKTVKSEFEVETMFLKVNTKW